MSVNEELLPLRNKIDGLDSELVRLLNERAEVAKAIGEIKAKAGLPVYRPEREAEVFKKDRRIKTKGLCPMSLWSPSGVRSCALAAALSPN